MSNFYKISLCFNGHNYYGWQLQKTLNTVQGELNKALAKIFKSTIIKTIGSGRTDAGVHSREHIVRAEVPFFIECKNLLMALNSHLPLDIRVLNVEISSSDFRPTNDAQSKKYFYLFSNQQFQEVMLLHGMANFRYPLDLLKMQQACECFIGEHDFKSFMCTGSEVTSTVRAIYECKIEYIDHKTFHNMVPPHYKFSVEGNGFLKQMVRLMVGAVWEIGRGKVSVDGLKQELNNPKGSAIFPVAPSCGLYKQSVKY